MRLTIFRLLIAIAPLSTSVSAGTIPLTDALMCRDKVTDVNICRPLAKGKCTLCVSDSMIDIPSPSRDPEEDFSDAQESNGQIILDNECNSITTSNAVKPLGTGKGFGDIEAMGLTEAVKFHAASIGLTNIGGISFTYKGKKFDKCDCQNDSKRLTGATACRCEFDCS